MENKERFREVESHKGFSVGDTIHIQRWYYGEGTREFNRIGNCMMVDVMIPIDKITIDDNTGLDTLWCDKFSTSSTDIANKGIVRKDGTKFHPNSQNPSLDKLVEYLEGKYQFSSTGDAYVINKLIEFYKENK